MTFEEEFKNILEEKLSKALPNKDIIVSNEFQFEPLYKNPDSVSVVIKNGTATRSEVPGYDLNVMPFTCNIKIKANSFQEVASAISSINDVEYSACKVYLGENDEGEDIYQDYFYKGTYSIPYTSGSPYDLGTEKSTIKVINLIWMMTVSYSKNAIIECENYKLKVDDELYDIKYILHKDLRSEPSYENSLEFNSDEIDRLYCNKNIAYQFTLQRVRNDSLQELLYNDFYGDSLLKNKSLGLKINTNEIINITGYTIGTVYEGNLESIVLKLLR